MREAFRVGLSRDFLAADGTMAYGDIGLGLLDAAPGIQREFIGANEPELRPQDITGFDALLLLAPKVSAATLAGSPRLRLIARFGVGYDNVDVAACTQQGVLLTITPDGVRRPVAVAALTLLLALAHRLFAKDHITRTGHWGDKLHYMGTGLTGRTLGLLGLGNIGREICTLVQPFDMHVLAADPYARPEQAAASGVELCSLDDVLARADFVVVCSALTPETHHLLNASKLALMKPTAFLVNVSRGPLIDQAALTEVLRSRRIGGAALDVFEQEPIDPHDPLLSLDNVIVTPHAIAWTDECFLGNGRGACQSILDVAAGAVPQHIVNRAALDHPRWKGK